MNNTAEERKQGRYELERLRYFLCTCKNEDEAVKSEI